MDLMFMDSNMNVVSFYSYLYAQWHAKQAKWSPKADTKLKMK